MASVVSHPDVLAEVAKVAEDLGIPARLGRSHKSMVLKVRKRASKKT
jgi:hypothetical protein